MSHRLHRVRRSGYSLCTNPDDITAQTGSRTMRCTEELVSASPLAVIMSKDMRRDLLVSRPQHHHRDVQKFKQRAESRDPMRVLLAGWCLKDVGVLIGPVQSWQHKLPFASKNSRSRERHPGRSSSLLSPGLRQVGYANMSSRISFISPIAISKTDGKTVLCVSECIHTQSFCRWLDRLLMRK